MPNLKRLDAYSCALKAIPDDISDCADLVHCGLHSNELSVLPSGLFECRKIVWLSLNMNKLSALPDGIGGYWTLISASASDLDSDSHRAPQSSVRQATSRRSSACRSTRTC